MKHASRGRRAPRFSIRRGYGSEGLRVNRSGQRREFDIECHKRRYRAVRTCWAIFAINQVAFVVALATEVGFGWWWLAPFVLATGLIGIVTAALLIWLLPARIAFLKTSNVVSSRAKIGR